MKINVAIIGGKAVQDLLKKKEKEIDKELNKNLAKACIKVEADAKKGTPVDTGRLRSSMTHEVREHIGKVGTNVDYAPHIEFGTSKMGPQPYLYPALQKNFDYIRKLLGNAVVKPMQRP